MTINVVSNFISTELSAGTVSQNIGFYTLIVLLGWMVIGQFKEKRHTLRMN